jgi:hypothetical protein
MTLPDTFLSFDPGVKYISIKGQEGESGREREKSLVRETIRAFPSTFEY